MLDIVIIIGFCLVVDGNIMFECENDVVNIDNKESNCCDYGKVLDKWKKVE